MKRCILHKVHVTGFCGEEQVEDILCVFFYTLLKDLLVRFVGYVVARLICLYPNNGLVRLRVCSKSEQAFCYQVFLRDFNLLPKVMDGLVGGRVAC